MDDVKKAILLVRVSTDKQDYNAQVMDLKSYAKDRGFNQFKIIETKETGFTDFNHKQGVLDMMKFVEENPSYNTVFITELSRYGRIESVLHKIREWHQNNNIQLIIKDDNFQLYDSYGKLNDTLIFSLYANMSAREMKNKMDRFARRRRELMSLGVSFGGKIMFGYKLEPMANGKNDVVKNEETADIVVRIFNWYLKGLNGDKNPSIKTISLECIKSGYPKYTHSKRNVNKLLKEEGYTGSKVTNNKRKNKLYGLLNGEKEFIYTSNKLIYDKIITRELYDKVQNKLAVGRVKTTKTTSRTTILSKIIKCPSCNRSLGGNHRNKNDYDKSSYRCTSRSDTIVKCDLVNKSYSMTLIDSALWSYIKTNRNELIKMINSNNPENELIIYANQTHNLVNRKAELQLELDNTALALNSLLGLTNSTISKTIDKQTKKLKRLDKEISNIDDELINFRSTVNQMLSRMTNDDYINENIDVVGENRNEIERYLKLLILSINVLRHSRRYTLLEVVKIDNSKYYLAIDKQVTRNPKMYGSYNYPNLVPLDNTDLDLTKWDIIKFDKLNKLALKDNIILK